MPKYTTDQEQILIALRDVHKRKVNERAELRSKIQAAYEAQLHELKLQEASLMIKGVDAGITKSDVGRAIGTTDWRTVGEMLDLGRSMVPVAEETRDRFTGYISYRSGTIVYLAVQDTESPHQHPLPNGVVHRGWKAVLQTMTDPATFDHFTSEVVADSPVVKWAVENWKTLPENFEGNG